MQGLWGEEIKSPLPRYRKQATLPTHSNPLRCTYYGHTWQRIGLSNEKQCTVCSIKGYCPGCTPDAPTDAQPISCTRHTPVAPQPSEVQL
jgi:hypothetical protein